jgi:hypothetical protein
MQTINKNCIVGYDLFSTPCTEREKKYMTIYNFESYKREAKLEEAQSFIITPAFAKEILEKYNIHNRSISKDRIAAMTLDMKNNNWVFTADPIRFFITKEESFLSDGQHRLHALINANKSIRFLCFASANPKSFLYIDTARQRTLLDFFSIHDSQGMIPYQCERVSRAAIFYSYFKEGKIGVIRNKNETKEEQVERRNKYVERIRNIDERYKEKKYFTSKMVGSPLTSPQFLAFIADAEDAYYANKNLNPEKNIDLFLEKFIDGIGLLRDDPVWHSKNLLQRFKNLGHRRASEKDTQNLLAETWNRFRKNQKIIKNSICLCPDFIPSPQGKKEKKVCDSYKPLI